MGLGAENQAEYANSKKSEWVDLLKELTRGHMKKDVGDLRGTMKSIETVLDLMERFYF